MNFAKLILYFMLYAVSYTGYAQYKIEVLDSNTFILGEGVVLRKTSFRGLSVVNNDVIWISGSRGTFARSTNGGKSFIYTQLKGYEKSDFRDIEAFDDKRAVMMSSGTPAYILKTNDGGQTWAAVYKNFDSAYFLDAMDFWDEKRGMLVGDPVNGHFVLLQTNDGGESWKEIDTLLTPRAMEGEAVFAASGTSLRCWNKKEYGFVTGGSTSRYINCKTNSKNIEYVNTRILSGKNSQGAFSFTLSTLQNKIFFAGGDYLNDTQSTCCDLTQGFIKSKDVGSNENALIGNDLAGYKSCIELFSDLKLLNGIKAITTGTSGTNLYVYSSSFTGNFFTIIAKYSTPFHVVRKAKKGNAVFLAGPNGKIGKLIR